MEDLVQFLRARLNEDERVAKACAGNGEWDAADIAIYGPDLAPEVRAHMANHDPARVLAEVEAKRQMLEEFTPAPREPETDSQLHARHAHPAFEYRTTEGPRKQWDYVDEPPLGDDGRPDPTWERNVDAGMPGEGWERFDYTEESYWRRRLPAGQERKPYIPRPLKLLALPHADHPDYQEEWRP